MLSTNVKLDVVLLLHSVHHHVPSSNDGHGYGDDTHHLEVSDLLDDDGGGGTAGVISTRGNTGTHCSYRRQEQVRTQ